MSNKHINMLLGYSELNNLFSESFNMETFFLKITNLISTHIYGDVCSFYLYDENIDELIIKASTEKNFNIHNYAAFKLENNYIGLSLKEYQTISSCMIHKQINSELFNDSGYEQYKSFIAIPIFRGKIRFGVIVIQSKKKDAFDNEDVIAMQIISSQLAFLIESAKLLLTLPTEKKEYKKTEIETIKYIKGEPASSGIAYSECIVYEKVYNIENIEAITKTINFTKDDFNRALKKTEEQLNNIQKEVEDTLSDTSSLIFTAHLLILKDKIFLKEIYDRIDKGEHIAKILLKIFNKYKKIFLKMVDPLIKEKIQDIEDLIIRLLTNMINLKIKKTDIDYDGKIIIAKKLFPSDIFKMSVENVKGVILLDIGISAHISILARSLNLPLVLANNHLLLNIPDNTKILLDANNGDIYHEPEIDFVNKRISETDNREKLLHDNRIIKSKTKTKDGTAFKILANINLLSDLKKLDNIEIDGVGLFRTEFPFIIRKSFPTEEEQYVSYKKLFNSMPDKEVTIRTLDIGGDKVLAYYKTEKENNPVLGLRSIRFSLKHIDIFKQQIKAILRAGYSADLKILFPLINSLEEFLKAKKIVNDCINELKDENTLCNNNPKIGLMVEVPSVVNMIEDYAKNADFFSIGTNDLIQYTLAVDRTNVLVSDLYIPHHPSILKSLKQITNAGNKYSIEVSLCGDMANNEKYIPFLIGIGITSLSVDAIYLPKVKKIVSELSIPQCKEIAEKLLSFSNIADIESTINKLPIY